ncbi:MAG: 3-deoxy-manno-octulosonate cytidylyltransferase [Ignavibacteriae bacterium]|nr:MAG: 3-deoxy-manno-octulosonate cytidylyltransferase [Ignavibacteriota bacterium]
MKIIGIIPARYESTRLPGKPLIKICGKPMIQHVWENAGKSKLIDKLVVATDNKLIYETVESFGGEAVLTSKKHKSGTDRIGEAAKKYKSDIVVNIQGDEPFISYKNIDAAIKQLLEDKKLNVSTLGYQIKDKEEINNPNVVKIVVDRNNNALYFSRSAVPYDRDRAGKIKYIKHIGLYVYRTKFLYEFIKLKQTEHEIAEKLEQLRVLDNGVKVKVVITKIDSKSIDTLDDLISLNSTLRI